MYLETFTSLPELNEELPQQMDTTYLKLHYLPIAERRKLASHWLSLYMQQHQKNYDKLLQVYNDFNNGILRVR